MCQLVTSNEPRWKSLLRSQWSRAPGSCVRVWKSEAASRGSFSPIQFFFRSQWEGLFFLSCRPSPMMRACLVLLVLYVIIRIRNSAKHSLQILGCDSTLQIFGYAHLIIDNSYLDLLLISNTTMILRMERVTRGVFVCLYHKLNTYPIVCWMRLDMSTYCLCRKEVHLFPSSIPSQRRSASCPQCGLFSCIRDTSLPMNSGTNWRSLEGL